MESNQVFSYRYSAKRNIEIERIRSKYLHCKESKTERLRRLDRRVQMAGRMQGIVVGTVGVMVVGIGICFWLGTLRGATWMPLLLSGAGIIVMLAAYPLYKSVAIKTRKRFVPEILRLAEEILEAHGEINKT